MAASQIDYLEDYVKKGLDSDHSLQFIFPEDERFSIPTKKISLERSSSIDYITKQDFDKIFEFFYSQLLLLHSTNENLSNENEDYKKRLFHLEMIVQKLFFDTAAKESHKNIGQLREVLQLPNINEKIDDNIIDELDGLLEDIFTENKNAIELLHEVRGE